MASYREYKGQRLGPYYRLAYREEGRQRSVYLGCDEGIVAGVKRLLAELHKPRERQKAMARLMKEAKARLRASLARLKEEVAAWGLTMRGLEVRGWRKFAKQPAWFQDACLFGRMDIEAQASPSG